MMDKNIHERLQRVFHKTFQDDNLVISSGTAAKDIKMWDSFMHVELISAIEREFNITFSFNEIIQFNTVGNILTAVEKKSNQ